MEFLGIGPLEFIFIILIALIILGPTDMVKAGRTIGRLLRKIVTSSEWKTIQQASKEFRYLPNRLIREAGLEEIKNEIDQNIIGGQQELDKFKKDYDRWKQDISSWTTPPEISTPVHEEDVESDQTNETAQKSNPKNSELD